ncbi:hypothetical protein ACJJTC_008616 [Scirpophaga incertulas]
MLKLAWSMGFMALGDGSDTPTWNVVKAIYSSDITAVGYDSLTFLQSARFEFSIKRRLSTTVQSHILTFFGHVSRRGDDSIERLVVQGRVEGTRPRGRSPMRWTDQIKAATKCSVCECTRKAAVRDEWRRITKSITRNDSQ